MTDKNWGGRRENAGRKKFGIAKAPHPTPDTGTDKPIMMTTGDIDTRGILGFPDLKDKVGVTILDQSIHTQVQTRMVQRGKEFLPEAGPMFSAAKSLYQPYNVTDPDSTAYEGMHKFYREYRRDTLVRSCINALAYYSTSEGFETVLEPVAEMTEEEAKRFVDKPQFKTLKATIDEINRTVNLDARLFAAIVNMKVYGLSGFEIVSDGSELTSLLPLDSQYLYPNLDNDWNLTGYHYNSEDEFYEPEEVLYFANLALTGDRIGLSDIEPIMDALLARRAILEQALPESTMVLWAGIGIVQVDTAGMINSEASTFINSLKDEFKPGKWVFVNQKIQTEVQDIDPKIEKLILSLEYLDQDIIGNFKVPRFIIGREKQVNRATAFAELEAFIAGPIEQIQKELSREIEAQWYTPIVEKLLGEDAPVKVKHNWNKITTADFTELMNSISQAYQSGWVLQEKAYDLAGFDPNELPKLKLMKQTDEQDYQKLMNKPPAEEGLVTSKPYDTKDDATQGIDNLKKMVEEAEVVDLTGARKKTLADLFEDSY